MSRRAFAMPMVIALVVVVGISTAVMLERQSAQRRTVDRQLRWYQEHHGRLGLQEAIEAWLKSLPSNADLHALLPADGHFLDLKLQGRSTATVHLYERQSAVLTDMSAVDEAMVDAAAAIANAVAMVYGEQGPPDGLRVVGPPQLSTHTTSQEVIELAVEAVTGDRSVAQGFAASIVADRESNGGVSTTGAVNAAINASGAAQELRTTLARLFTVRPTLYYAVVELRTSTYGPPSARYGGYFSIANDRSLSSTERSAFLTWENLALE